ncbi:MULTISPECIES: hypothetical protein [unclassified Romboutsia]|uniref:hypothetical protein n=1 Tax=unclassified Romboutsia TaxID=2626894 RepID=UPI000F052806|nr:MULTISPECIES: hypothetical protein [unclassified Romboutsia]
MKKSKEKDKKNNKIKDINEYKKKKQNKHKNRSRKTAFKKSRVILTFAFVSSIMIVNLCGYAKISELRYDIYYLEKDLRSKEIIIEQLNSNIYSNTSIEEIENMAKEKLNMDYPNDNQIEYITVED